MFPNFSAQPNHQITQFHSSNPKQKALQCTNKIHNTQPGQTSSRLFLVKSFVWKTPVHSVGMNTSTRQCVFNDEFWQQNFSLRFSRASECT